MKKNILLEVFSIRSIILFVVVYLLISVFLLQGRSRMKVTNEDYKPLYKQAKIIESDFESIKKMDNVRCDFIGKSKAITLESEKCSLMLIFNNNVSKINDYVEQNRVVSIIYVLMVSLVFTSLLMYIISFIFDCVKNKRI